MEDLPESGSIGGKTDQTVSGRDIIDSPVSLAEFDIVIVTSDFG